MGRHEATLVLETSPCVVGELSWKAQTTDTRKMEALAAPPSRSVDELLSNNIPCRTARCSALFSGFSGKCGVIVLSMHYQWQSGTHVDWTAAYKIEEHKESGPLPLHWILPWDRRHPSRRQAAVKKQHPFFHFFVLDEDKCCHNR